MDTGLVDSRSWWWTGRPGVLRFMGSQRVGHDWVTKNKMRNEHNCTVVWIFLGIGFLWDWNESDHFQLWPPLSLVQVFNSLRPHGLQHARLPCPSPTPGACSNSCPLSQWCHPTISSSVIPFSSCLQSFPSSGSFPMSQFFASGGQSIEVSASASVPPMNIQDWFPLGLTGWISLQSKGSQESSPTAEFKSINYLAQAFFIVQLSQPYMTTEKNHSFD